MIEVQDLSKFYGEKRALGPVSFDIEKGETIGFLGLNGAGKTTALRIFATDLRPSSGSVSVDGIDAVENPHEVRKRIGFLPENPPLYQDMAVRDYVIFAGKLREMSASQVRERLPEALELTHLSDVADERIGTLSHGYRQRVGVAQAIIHKPSLLILDEPTRGLDPVQIVEMRNMIRNLKGEYTVLISSHILTEISETCDRLLVLGEGALIASGSKEELMESKGIEVTVAASSEESAQSALKAVDGAGEVEEISRSDSELSFSVACEGDIRAQAAQALVSAGCELLRIDQGQQKLESIFMKLVKGGRDASN